MKDFLKYGLKAYFGGCLGCLGVFSMFLVVVVIFSLVFGPQLMGGITTFLQSIQGAVSQGLSPFSGSTPSGSMNPARIEPMEVFLTMENNPEATHITSFSVAQSDQVYFWVRTQQDEVVYFNILLTFPDGNQHQFGPTFQTSGVDEPTNCGQFSGQAPQTGQYKLEVMPLGGSSPVASIEFTVKK